jgi:hypothetical protein
MPAEGGFKVKAITARLTGQGGGQLIGAGTGPNNRDASFQILQVRRQRKCPRPLEAVSGV